MAPPPLSSLKRTQETLEYAIAANHKLQDATRRQLIKLGQIKAENRRLASKLTKHMTCAWDQLDRRKIRETKISPIGDSILQSMITNDEIEELTTSSETIHGTKRKTTTMNKTKKTVAKKPAAKKPAAKPVKDLGKEATKPSKPTPSTAEPKAANTAKTTEAAEAGEPAAAGHTVAESTKKESFSLMNAADF